MEKINSSKYFYQYEARKVISLAKKRLLLFFNEDDETQAYKKDY